IALHPGPDLRARHRRPYPPAERALRQGSSREGMNSYQLYVITSLGLTTMVGVGLNILLGLSGQVSLGHVGFYAIGAYTTAILTTTYGPSFWAARAAAAPFTANVG